MTELCNPLQDGRTPLHYAVKGGHTTSVERLLSTPGIDVNIKDGVSSFLNHTDVNMYMYVSVLIKTVFCM